MQDSLGARFVGHVTITDKTTGEVLVDKDNAINFETMSIAIAQSLANRSTGFIFEMDFGNGGSVVSGIGVVTYFPPNVTGQTAALYNQTYSKVVDDLSPLNTDPTNCYMRVQHTAGTTYSDIVVACTLEAGEPSAQDVIDNATQMDSDYVFNELGLRAYAPIQGTGLLLSHVIFHPVQKSLNRVIEIVYTVRIFMN